jgi:ribosomal protein L40E
MSNHRGSYLLNEVLHLLEQRGVFELLGRAPIQELVLELLRLSDRYDCNPGEILEESGQRLGVCYYCRTAQDEMKEGVCRRCRAEGLRHIDQEGRKRSSIKTLL